MDFSELRRLPLGDALDAVVSEGGATVGGFTGAGVLGRRIQAMGITDAEVITTMDGIKAAAYNNGPKIAAWYFLRGRNLFGSATPDVNKGIVTSVAFDLLMRALNKGKNPSTATIFGYEAMGENQSLANVDANIVQKLIQENAMMKKQLGVQSVEGPMSPRLPPYVGSAIMNPDERERKYAFMPGMATPGVTRPPGTERREVRYGFAGEVNAMSTTGRPGAAYVQAGKMFGMQ
jgi:hypothetical protein